MVFQQFGSLYDGPPYRYIKSLGLYYCVAKYKKDVLIIGVGETELKAYADFRKDYDRNKKSLSLESIFRREWIQHQAQEMWDKIK